MREGDKWVQRHSRKSLRLLGSVGEPINPEAWEWYHRVIGDHRCPIVDTWWQTETGGIPDHAIGWGDEPQAGFRGAAILWCPACAGQRHRVNALRAPAPATWCLTDSWPGQMRTVYGDTSALSTLTFAPTPAAISRAMARAVTRMAITG